MEQILEISREMNTQNNRSTQSPLFVIQYEDKVVCPEGFSDDAMIVNTEGEEIDQEKLCKKCREEVAEYGVMNHEINCKKCGEHRVWCYRIEEKFDLEHGVFLTAKACNEYIQRRSYAMRKNACSFAISSYWSDDMRTVLAHLSSLTTNHGKPASQYST